MDNPDKHPKETERTVFKDYWSIYGGWRALFCSPYFVVSCVVASFLAKWSQRAEWWETSLSVVPSVLGFSLGGYAMLFAFGSESFHRLMATAKTEGNSVLITVSATFVHFILVQCLAIVVALLAQALAAKESPPAMIELLLAFLGVLLLCYTIATAVAATMWIFRLSRVLALQLELDAAADEGAGQQSETDRSKSAVPKSPDTDR